MDRVHVIRGFGATVEQCPTPELQQRVDSFVEEKNASYAHPFDDRKLISGYGSIGLELVEDAIEDLDIIVVGIGGGTGVNMLPTRCAYGQ